MVAILSATYLYSRDIIILNPLSTWFMTEILLSNLAFHGRVFLFDFFQYFITETSTWSYILKPLSISYLFSLYIRLVVIL